MFLDFSYQHRLEWGKSMIFKNNVLKVGHWVFLNSFETMLKNAKNDANILKKMYFFGFSLFFRYFWNFLKIYQNMGQKLDNNI
jgi:hypothetical protein